MIIEEQRSAYLKYLEDFNPKGWKEQLAREDRWKSEREKMNTCNERSEDFKNKYQSQRKKYVDWLDVELMRLPDINGKLQLLTNNQNMIRQLIKESDWDTSGNLASHYEDLLDEVITPWKIRLNETVELENRITTFLQNQKWLQKIPVKEILPKEELIQTLDVGQIKVDEKQTILLQETKVKEKSDGRRFEWSDIRIPELLSIFFVEKCCISESQKTLMVEFLTKGICKTHIAWKKKGNILTTAFYDLKRNNFLRGRQDYIAERIEKNIFCGSDTLKPISTKATIIASFSPGDKSVKKRAHKEDPEYLDVITYLQEKLQSKS